MGALSIMQPYVFPYLGYFHLIEATDKIIFYDDVNYVKRGWINRNRILLNNSDFLFTIPVKKASQNKMINEIEPRIDDSFRNKFLGQLVTAYKKAPHYNQVSALVEEVIDGSYESIADLAIRSVTSVYNYLGKEIDWSTSSEISPETQGIDRADRLIRITKDQGFETYINAIGGQELYTKEYFKNEGVELGFVKSEAPAYEQFGAEFVPWLSIIDVLMFNDKEVVLEQFQAYKVI